MSCQLSIIIPVYGSEHILPELVSKINQSLNKLYENYEIIFVCDQSPDQSWNVIKSLSQQAPNIKGILLQNNVGQHNALMAGLKHAKGEIIVTMDDDLQHSPKDISSLTLEIEKGHDVAYACFKEHKHPLWKIMGSRLNDQIAVYLLNKPKGLYLSPFRAMKSSIRDALLRYSSPHVYLDALILSVTHDIVSIEVDHHERHAGESRYGLKKSLALWFNMLRNNSIMAKILLTKVSQPQYIVSEIIGLNSMDNEAL